MSSCSRTIALQDFHERGAAVWGLCRAFMSGAPVHAALIVGPAGVGKRTLAKLLAQTLHCQADEKPCGVCPACIRFLSGNHPDAHRIEEKKRITIEETRALTAALSSTPFEGGYKTIRIENAGAMTPQAQNSLLKTLEEPTGDAVFLLTAVSMGQLLPTIVSRCGVVPLPPLAEERVASALLAQGAEEQAARRAAALAGGSVGLALSLLGDSNFWRLRQIVHDAMEAIRGSSDVWIATDALKDEKEQSGRIADILEGTIRAALRGQALSQGIPETGWERKLLKGDPASLLSLLQRTILLRRMLQSNVSWQAAMERFALDYAEEIVRWQL